MFREFLLVVMVRQFFSFAGVGAIGTGAHYITLIGTVRVGLDPVAASALGCTIGAAINYLLNYRFTFRSSITHWRSAPRFALVAASSIVLNTVLMAVAVKWLGLHYLLAQILTTCLILCWNFVISRYWAFRERGPAGTP